MAHILNVWASRQNDGSPTFLKKHVLDLRLFQIGLRRQVHEDKILDGRSATTTISQTPSRLFQS